MIEKILIETTSPEIFKTREDQLCKYLTENISNLDFFEEKVAFGDNFELVSSIVIYIGNSILSGVIYDYIKQYTIGIYKNLSNSNFDKTFVDLSFHENGNFKRISFARPYKGKIKIKNGNKWVIIDIEDEK